VTVGREADKVKPNGKKRMNLRAVTHVPGVRRATCPPPAWLAGSLAPAGFPAAAITRNSRLLGVRCYWIVTSCDKGHAWLHGVQGRADQPGHRLLAGTVVRTDIL
jgi:hypothetical protein